MDTITLSQKDFDMLFEWRDNHKDYVRNFKPVMTEGRIVIGTQHEQVFKDEGPHYTYVIYKDGKVIHEVKWYKLSKRGTVVKSVLKEDFHNQYTESVISLHASLMAYMEYYSDKKEYVAVEEVRTVKKKKDKKGKVKKASNTVKIRKVYRVHINQTSVQLDKRRYERVMEKWNVRGHWRQYKSGKKVWIEPQVRGTGKNITPKNYKLGE